MTPNQLSPKQLYAHSLPDQPEKQWQTLAAHLEKCAELTRDSAIAFGSGPWGEQLGNKHDVGKARESFQKYLKHANGLLDASYDGSDHSHSGVGPLGLSQSSARLGAFWPTALPDTMRGCQTGQAASRQTVRYRYDWRLKKVF